MYDNNSAFFMDASGNGLGVGSVEAQTLSTFTNAAIAGKYEVGHLAPLAANIADSIGERIISSSGTVAGTNDNGGLGLFSWEAPISSSYTYAWDLTAPGTGTFIESAPSSSSLSCAAITSTKVVCLNQNSNAADMWVGQQ